MNVRFAAKISTKYNASVINGVFGKMNFVNSKINAQTFNLLIALAFNKLLI
jgi:hypothetical protein